MSKGKPFKLGVYQRKLARRLESVNPLDKGDAVFCLWRRHYEVAAQHKCDYTKKTVESLIAKGIASGDWINGIVRGPNWESASAYYGWSD